jgi:hypothetical protein
MAKMNKDEIKIRFAELSDLASDENKKVKNKLGRERFIPMRQERHGKLQEFGLYDYVTKRYTLGNIHAGNAQKILNEMKVMLAVHIETDALFSDKLKS